MARVEIDKSALEKIRHSPDLAKQLERKLEPVMAAAIATSPDSPDIGKGYKKSFRIVSGVDKDGAVARVINYDFKANWVEFGAHAGGKTMVLRYRVLGRALVRIR